MKVPNKVLNIVSRFAAEGTHPTITPEERELVFAWAKAGIDKRAADALEAAALKAAAKPDVMVKA